MTSPEPLRRAPMGGVIAVWVVAVVVAVATGILAPAGGRSAWLAIDIGALVFVSLAVQLAAGRPEGFIRRVALSAVGAAIVLGAIVGVFGMISLFSA